MYVRLIQKYMGEKRTHWNWGLNCTLDNRQPLQPVLKKLDMKMNMIKLDMKNKYNQI